MVCVNTRSRWATVSAVLASLVTLASYPSVRADDGAIQQLREDVRVGSPGNNTGAPPSQEEGNRHRHSATPESDPDQEGWTPGSIFGAGWFAGYVVTSPVWLPIQILDDDYSVEAGFPRFPYDDVPGHIITDPQATTTRRWAARLSTEYREPFEHIQVVGGRLLVDTTTRFGVDTQWDYLQEDLAGGHHDQIWSGDCNLVFRFAQGAHAEFRTGLGFNWLDDPQQTDFGFNFTYGFDFFPVRPWVLSTDIDWGTLGKAELFRLRTTVGAVLHGVEAYTGYEYFDVGRLQLNCLIGGLRIWF